MAQVISFGTSTSKPVLRDSSSPSAQEWEIFPLATTEITLELGQTTQFANDRSTLTDYTLPVQPETRQFTLEVHHVSDLDADLFTLFTGGDPSGLTLPLKFVWEDVQDGRAVKIELAVTRGKHSVKAGVTNSLILELGYKSDASAVYTDVAD